MLVPAVLLLLPAASLLVSGDPDKGRSIADQETLATSINRLVGLLGQAQQYVDDVLVSPNTLIREFTVILWSESSLLVVKSHRPPPLVLGRVIGSVCAACIKKRDACDSQTHGRLRTSQRIVSAAYLPLVMQWVCAC